MSNWLVGLLAAAVSALAGASTWLVEDDEARLARERVGIELDDDLRETETEPSRAAWQERRAPPSLDVVHPLAAFTDEEIGVMAAQDIRSLGSISIGSPGHGRLVNGVHFPTSPLWKLADPEHSWGTEESVEFVRHALERVNEELPGGHTIYVGDFSAQHGGPLKPHKSHQSGRDVDLGYYYLDESVWYRRATAANMDRPRNWLLLETLITETRVQYVFIDRHVQPLLEEYGLAIGVDPEWVRRVFHGTEGRKDSIVRHRWGHATHMHVRFENPTAELTGRRSVNWLKKLGILPRVDYYPKPRSFRRRARRVKKRNAG